ncbi:MAG TPA: IPT/TIG domain-containing protein [Thermoanaerobaculia bacterium]|nr:IPT/TIG domain-containing protein [Thermoanaerobaculia bacterium]
MTISQDVLTRADALRRGTNISLTDAITISQRIGSALPIASAPVGGTTGGIVAGANSPGRPAIPPTSAADPGVTSASSIVLIPNVLPGDLITAGLTNIIINRLNDVYVQLLQLESAATSNNEVVITSLVPPSGNVKVGDLLTVNGQNFGVSTGLMRVFVDDTPITGLQSGSDQQIVFQIPLTFTDVPSNGRPAIVTITNQSTSGQRTIVLQPAQSLAGGVEVNVRGVQPATPQSSIPATFEFQLVSGTNLDATYNVSASVVPNLDSAAARSAGWQGFVHILDSDQTTEVQQVHLAPNQQKTLFVRINPIPPNSDGVSFDVTLTVQSTSGNAGGSSGAHTYKVGTPADVPDTTITIGGPSLATGSGTGSATATTVTVNSANTHLSYPATFTLAGIYNIDIVLGNGAANLNTAVLDPPTSPLVPHATLQIFDTELHNPQGMASKNILIALGSKTGSTAGNVTLKVQRQGETRMVTKTMQLQLG